MSAPEQTTDCARIGELRLRLVQEECGEVIVACSKALRFGIDGCDPRNDEINRGTLQREMTDLYRRMREAAMHFLIPWREISEDGCMPKPPPEETV